MTLRSVARIGVLAAALLFGNDIAVAASAQPNVEVVGGDASEVVIADDGTATHRGSGLAFPSQIGDMSLRGLTVYGASDASALYRDGEAWLTFYVYLATISLDDEIAGVEQAMMDRLKGRRVDAPAAAPQSLNPGRSAWFEGKYQNIDALTGYMVAQRGRWFLKARFTAPKEAGQAAIDSAVKALADLPWNWQPAASKTEGAVVAAR